MQIESLIFTEHEGRKINGVFIVAFVCIIQQFDTGCRVLVVFL